MCIMHHVNQYLSDKSCDYHVTVCVSVYVYILCYIYIYVCSVLIKSIFIILGVYFSIKWLAKEVLW